ncbi:MAG: ABC transporter permease [Cryomorphaceae bacterium]
MKGFKDLVGVKKTEKKQEPESNHAESNGRSEGYVNFSKLIGDRMTIYQKGFGDAKNAVGALTIFENCLSQLYQQFRAMVRDDEKYQDDQKQPIRDEIVRVEAEIEKREALIAIKENKIDEHKEKVKQLEYDIDQVPVNPQKYGVDASKKPKAQFYIGLFILFPITLYLIVFYISASYSAFFKNFETSALTAAIFDAQAFSNALKDGALEAIFVGTIPFVFMGLGYLIHMFQKEGTKGRLKIIGMFAVTFIFDVILAYQIEKKIYEFNRTLNSPDFNFKIAVQSVEFWGIIFAGFVVYIIWGLVFDFVMKEYENFDKIKIFISSLVQKKETEKGYVEELQKEKTDISSGITSLKEELQKHRHQLNSVFFPSKDYLEYHTEYTKGWMMGVQKEVALGIRENAELLEGAKKICLIHLEKIGVSERDEQITEQLFDELIKES